MSSYETSFIAYTLKKQHFFLNMDCDVFVMYSANEQQSLFS
jgi:hypothetical protein